MVTSKCEPNPALSSACKEESFGANTALVCFILWLASPESCNTPAACKNICMGRAPGKCIGMFSKAPSLVMEVSHLITCVVLPP